MELIEAKITAIISLTLGTMLVGLIPACFTRRGLHHWSICVSSLLCFGGGVLLSTSLLHMLPEAREIAPKYEQYAEIVLCAGFFLLYVLDELVHLCYNENHQTHSYTQNIGHHHHQVHLSNTSQAAGLRYSTSYGSIENTPLYNKERQPPYNPSFRRCSSENEIKVDTGTTSQLCHVGHEEPCHVTPVGTIGLLVALSIHAALEGLAVGLEGSTSKVLLLLGAIASHKLVVGFSLGLELSTTPGNTACRHFTAIAVFALGSALGIAMGMVVTKVAVETSNTAIALLQELAAGSLLYVTVSEILPRERAKWHSSGKKSAGMFQFAAVAIGFTAMTLLTRYLE